jgi:DNA modification methylase
VLDPFAGSGSTGIAVLKEQRRFIGIEQDTGYMEIARARLTDFERGSAGGRDGRTVDARPGSGLVSAAQSSTHKRGGSGP